MYKLYSATIELTSQCNAKCKHCIVDAGKALDSEMTTDRIIRLIEELADQGCQNIVFTGGEALLRREFPLFLEKAKGLNLEIILMTNGLLLNDSTINILKLFDLSLGISLDGADAKTHDSIRGVDGLFDHIVKIIPKLKKAGIYTVISTTVMQSNFDKLDKIKDLLLKLKVNAWQLQVLKPCERVTDSELLTEDQYYKLAQKIVEYRKKFGKKMMIYEADCIGYNSKLTEGLYIKEWRGCECGIFSVSISSDGSVKGCPNMNNSEGNLNDKTFEEIWQDHNSFAYNRRPDLSNLPTYCKECEHKYVCRGGCPTNQRTTKNNTLCLHKIETIGCD
ncbi:MAG: radical SAM protein [Muribaculaceae bacterium]|nr:radical SAM protein [Muribaculaceae bacterium]